MKIMTFNIRFENDRDGQNAWVYRRDLVIQLIERYAPDVLGTQEGRWAQLLFLRDHLPGYALNAPDRTIDSTCQYPTLFIKTKTFAMLGGEEFWLSKTPHIHRSKNWDSAFPRMINGVLVADRKSGEKIWIAVTHLDHKGVTARREQAGIIADWVQSRENPVLLMGDFNDVPGSAVHQRLLKTETGLVDTWEVLGKEEGQGSYTHHAFTGIPQNGRIDWVLASRSFTITDGHIIRDHFDERYPSDHFPYLVNLHLPAAA
jgi:endonuclease/exonuclease/phosphatase family metal-dependent hydrolase